MRITDPHARRSPTYRIGGWGYGGSRENIHCIFDVLASYAIVHLSVAFGSLAQGAVAQKGYTVNYITKTAIAKAFDSIDASRVATVFETAVGKVDISELMSQIVDASAHTDRSGMVWKDAAKTAWDLGIRVDMITPRIPDGVGADGKTKKTKKNPGCNRELYASIIQANLAGLSASRAPAVYTIPRPNAPGADVLARKVSAFTWTALEVVNCPSAYLVGKVDDNFTPNRIKFRQWAGGRYISLLQGHLTDLEFPDRKAQARAARLAEKEANEDTAAEPNAPLLQRAKDVLNELIAGLLAMKRADGATMSGVVQAHEAVCEAVARLGQVK